jgi:hypothetical protein
MIMFTEFTEMGRNTNNFSLLHPRGAVADHQVLPVKESIPDDRNRGKRIQIA